MGSEGLLVSWPRVVHYFQALAKASDRVEPTSMRPSTLGNDMALAIISSPSQHAKL